MVTMNRQKKFEELSYKELLEIRNEILSFITKFESDFNMDKLEWDMFPMPDVRYQVYLRELREVVELLAARFNKEYEWSEKGMKGYYEDMKKIKSNIEI